MKLVGIALLLVSLSSLVLAGNPVPEVGPGTGAGALTLVTGALLVIRGRRKK